MDVTDIMNMNMNIANMNMVNIMLVTNTAQRLGTLQTEHQLPVVA